MAETRWKVSTQGGRMNFETYVEFVVFSDNPAKWKIEQLQKAILERKTGAKDAKGSKTDSLF